VLITLVVARHRVVLAHFPLLFDGIEHDVTVRSGRLILGEDAGIRRDIGLTSDDDRTPRAAEVLLPWLDDHARRYGDVHRA
jgi:hypothetical protein